MADSNVSPTDPTRRRTPMPRWVKAFLIAGIAIVTLLVVVLLTGHGPGRHGSAGAGGSAPTVAAADA
jgi:hypothetical protein